jgi:molybdopterin-guanine dinucleotide biosynthesis protein A
MFAGIGGVILCGGKSSRMGHAKAMLPFGDKLMLQHVVNILEPVVAPIVVAAAAGQQLPDLPASVRVVIDEQPDLGPLQGIYTGLRALADECQAVYVTSCDVPLLKRKVIEAVIASLQQDPLAQIAVVQESGFFHPLAGVYGTALIEQIRALLDADQRRPLFLFEKCKTIAVQAEMLRQYDPELHSLMNLNQPQDYLDALQIAFGSSDQGNSIFDLG